MPSIRTYAVVMTSFVFMAGAAGCAARSDHGATSNPLPVPDRALAEQLYGGTSYRYPELDSATDLVGLQGVELVVAGEISGFAEGEKSEDGYMGTVLMTVRPSAVAAGKAPTGTVQVALKVGSSTTSEDFKRAFPVGSETVLYLGASTTLKGTYLPVTPQGWSVADDEGVFFPMDPSLNVDGADLASQVPDAQD